MSSTARRSRDSNKKLLQLRLARKSKAEKEKKRGEKAPVQNASMRKLLCDGESYETNDLATQQWLLLHVARLNELIHELVCPNCAGSGLRVTIDPQNQGFCSTLMLECTLCDSESKYSRSVFSSTRLGEESRSDVAFDVNVRMVVLAHELGLGYAGLRKVSKILGIPGLHIKTYQRHDRRVTGELEDR